MKHDQVRYAITNTNNFSHTKNMRFAIDLLLSSKSMEVSEPTVKLTECSPEIEVIMNKQGGICTRCNRMFKSRVSLTGHLIKCYNESNGDESNGGENNNKNNENNNNNQPKLIIVQQ